MTIERGGVWGEPAADAIGSRAVIAASTDAEIAALAFAGHDVIELTCFDGDLARTVGVEQRRPESEQHAYPFDLGLVRLDEGDELPFVAGLVARRALWRGEFALIANGGWLGRWYIGPKAHPNDGRLDVTVGALGPVQRYLAFRRLPTGTHLPHPDLKTRRTDVWDHRFSSPVTVSTDRVAVGRARSIRVSVRADCFMLVV